MHKLSTIILSMAAVTALVMLVAVIGGTCIWLLWPHVIPAVFPGAVSSGLVAKELGFQTSVLLSWLCQCMFSKNAVSKSGDK